MANPQVQLRALKAIPPLVDVIDYGTLRSVVYPRLEVRACVLKLYARAWSAHS